MKTHVFDGVHMRFLISVFVDSGCTKQTSNSLPMQISILQLDCYGLRLLFFLLCSLLLLFPAAAGVGEGSSSHGGRMALGRCFLYGVQSPHPLASPKRCAAFALFQITRSNTVCPLCLAFRIAHSNIIGLTRCALVVLLQEARPDMFLRTACTLRFVFQNAFLNHEKRHFAIACAGNFASYECSGDMQFCSVHIAFWL